MSTITITFGDVAENHVGMQKIGNMAKEGFTVSELENAETLFKKKGCKTEFVRLNEYLPDDESSDEAAILIIREGLKLFIKDTEAFHQEESDREWDTKALMRGKVVNKHARYNLCYSDNAQEPDFGSGKGRIISFDESKGLTTIRNKLHLYLGDKAKSLKAEGNKYYDTTKCGIGFHGDAERKIVVAFRTGESMALRYLWFLNNQPIGEPVTLTINGNDMYIMSSKAVGTDWKKRLIPTLRHAAGCEKYISMDIFKKRAEKKTEDANGGYRKKQTARKSPVSKFPRISHASKIEPKAKIESKEGNVAIATNTKVIFYCKKCGYEAKGKSFTQEYINEFRKHSNKNGDSRCLDKGHYEENHAEVLGMYFYVMGTK